MPAGVEDLLLDGRLDLRAVGVSEWLDASVPSRTSRESVWTSTLTDDAGGCAASMMTSARQRVTSIVRS
jgi:hypothetical protein